MKTYTLFRNKNGDPNVVFRRHYGTANFLDPGYKYINRSPDGFEWGYSGEGPAQLAFAILLDVLGVGRLVLAKTLYEKFKAAFLVGMDVDGGEISEIEVLKFIVDNMHE